MMMMLMMVLVIGHIPSLDQQRGGPTIPECALPVLSPTVEGHRHSSLLATRQRRHRTAHALHGGLSAEVRVAATVHASFVRQTPARRGEGVRRGAPDRAGDVSPSALQDRPHVLSG